MGEIKIKPDNLEKVEMVSFVQKDIEDSELKRRVDQIAESLLSHLNLDETLQSICLANQPGRSSSKVQDTFVDFASSLGFQSEAKGLFEGYPSSSLRPDYYMDLGGKNGILIEVERGKTTINNMDLLDMWKCHLCEHANFLFLMVPKELRQNPKMSPRKEFQTVSKRLEAFFYNGNYTNVLGLYIFGY